MKEASEQIEALVTAFNSFLKEPSSDSLSDLENHVNELIETVKAVSALPEPVYKRVLDAVVEVSFHRFTDRQYFTILSRLVDTLFELDPVLSLKHLVDAVFATASPNVALLITRTATGATFVARWLASGIITNKKLGTDEVLLKKAVSAFANAAFYGAYLPKRVLSLSNQVNKLFLFDPNLVISSLKEFSGDGTRGDLKTLVLIALLLKKDSAASKSDNLPMLKTIWLDTYCKTALMAEASLNTDYFAKLNTVLSNYTPKELYESFLPYAKKALLRDPEIAAPAILDFVKYLQFETDIFAIEFFDAFASSIVSTSDSVREASAGAVGVVGSRIVDSDILEQYLQRLFNLFRGNKNPSERLSLAIAILAVCKNVKSDPAKLPEVPALNFKRMLPFENNSTILRLIWQAFTTWLLKGERLEVANIHTLRIGVHSCFPNEISAYSKSLALASTAIILDHFSNIPVDDEILAVATNICAAAKTEETIHLDFIPAASIVLLANTQKSERVDSGLFEILATKDSLNREEVYTSLAGEQGNLIPILAKRALLSSIRPPNAMDYPAPIIKLLISSLVWPNYAVRQTAIDVVKKLCIVEGTKFRNTITESVLESVRTGAFNKMYSIASGNQSPDQNTYKVVVPSSFYAKALLSLLPENKADFDSEDQHLALLASSMIKRRNN